MNDDLSKKRELNDAARDLLDNKAFTQAILELRKHWLDKLMGDLHREQQEELIAMMKALEAIPAELTVIMNDYKMAMKRQAHG